MEKRFEHVQKMEAKASHHCDLSAADINDFKVFWWLSKPEWEKTIQSVDSIIRKRNGAEKKEEDDEHPAGASSSSTGPPASKKKKGDAKAQDAVMASVMSKLGGF